VTVYIASDVRVSRIIRVRVRINASVRIMVWFSFSGYLCPMRSSMLSDAVNSRTPFDVLM